MSTVAVIALACAASVPVAWAEPAPVLNLGTHIQSHNGVATVLKGDTLWRISQRYDLPMNDIIAVNNLRPPYTLSAGQRLILPAPRRYTVGAHDTLYAVARMYGVEVSDLVQLNHLQAPYRLHVGDVLRIPSSHLTIGRAQKHTVVASAQRGMSVKAHKAAADRALPVDKPVKTATLTPAPRPAPPQPVTTVSSSHRDGFIWPVHGRVISSYGPKEGGLYNDGINIAAPRSAPVAAAADGVVAYVGDGLKSYGNLVLIRHPGGMVTTYAHLSSVTVRAGQSVRRGQVIGTVGSTGSVSSAQLHFEVRTGTRTLDPRKYLG
jgi:murein DD-endopeptidase MepM/ murein hydrolase activator NlpD